MGNLSLSKSVIKNTECPIIREVYQPPESNKKNQPKKPKILCQNAITNIYSFSFNILFLSIHFTYKSQQVIEQCYLASSHNIDVVSHKNLFVCGVGQCDVASVKCVSWWQSNIRIVSAVLFRRSCLYANFHGMEMYEYS